MTRRVGGVIPHGDELALVGEGWHHVDMGRRKSTPDRSSIVRAPVIAPSKRQRGDDDKPDDADDKPDDKPDDKKADAAKDAPVAAPAVATPAAAPAPAPTPAPIATAPTPAPTTPVDAAPPNTPPAAKPAAPSATSGVESPAAMPGPKHIPDGDPNDPAPAPGSVPRGDSRSLRKATEFALVYRTGTFVITRSGTVGRRGVWRVVEYPSTSMASHAYAKECSRFASEGFSDYRE